MVYPDIFQRQGSRICVKLGKQRAVFHSPHPQKETVKGAVDDIRAFLKRAGIQPWVQNQLNLCVHAGGKTTLELSGFGHNLQLGKKQKYIFCHCSIPVFN